MKVKAVKIDTLALDSDNARKHSDRNLLAIKESLSRFGQRKPIVVRGSKVLAGNGTLEAAKALGWTEIQIAEAPDDWDEDTAKAYALADNRTAELAEWDEVVLARQLLELQDVGWEIEHIGFDAPEVSVESVTDAFGDLPVGERNDATQITFTLTLVQAEEIKMALRQAKEIHNFEQSDNKNSNGNAIYMIVKEWQDGLSEGD
jgi:hypothetical protein